MFEWARYTRFQPDKNVITGEAEEEIFKLIRQVSEGIGTFSKEFEKEKEG